MERIILVALLAGVLLFALRYQPKPEPKIDIPAKIIRRVIFGENETPPAASASSSDSGDSGSAMTKHPESSSTYPCTEDEFRSLQADLKESGAAEMDLQIQLVNAHMQLDELRQENARLRNQYPKPITQVTQSAQTARTTYGNSYNRGVNCGPAGCFPARGRGIFGRR